MGGRVLLILNDAVFSSHLLDALLIEMCVGSYPVVSFDMYFETPIQLYHVSPPDTDLLIVHILIEDPTVLCRNSRYI